MPRQKLAKYAVIISSHACLELDLPCTNCVVPMASVSGSLTVTFSDFPFSLASASPLFIQIHCEDHPETGAYVTATPSFLAVTQRKHRSVALFGLISLFPRIPFRSNTCKCKRGLVLLVPTADICAGVEIKAPTDHDMGIASSSPSTDPHCLCVVMQNDDQQAGTFPPMTS